jgi:hypothetical protein
LIVERVIHGGAESGDVSYGSEVDQRSRHGRYRQPVDPGDVMREAEHVCDLVDPHVDDAVVVAVRGIDHDAGSGEGPHAAQSGRGLM